MSRQTFPLDLWLLGLETARLAVEAQAVIAMRMAGMMGLWAVRPAEFPRMLAEKQRAAAAAGGAAGRAALAGKRPAAVLRAGLKPIGRRVTANSRRLARLGPALGKPRR